MLSILGALILATLALVFVSLQKTYSHIPRAELKRRAQKGDQFAQLLFRPAAYGMSLQVLLWLFIGLTSAGFFILLASSVPGWLALLGALALLWFGFGWLPNSRVTALSNALARYLTPPLAWILERLYPLLGRLSDWLSKHRQLSVHTGLYEKEDLLKLLEQQKVQAGSRINPDELRIASGALSYGDKLVRDIMTPKRVVTMVASTDSIGPVLLNELHGSGHSRFPVYQDKPDNVIGMLYLRDLVGVSDGGRVRDHIHKYVMYVNEAQTLNKVLEAFLKTKSHLFMVVNGFEETVGIITIEDILEQIVGKPIMDEFDKYDDMRAVAALDAKKDRKENAEKMVE